MSEPGSSIGQRGPKAWHSHWREPLALLRQSSLRSFLLSRLCSGTSLVLLQVAIAWQVYQISGSALALGILGLVRFLPAAGAALIGGAAADSFDRRRVVMFAQTGPLLGALALLVASREGAAHLALIYTLVFLLALASVFDEPAGEALLPLLVPRERFAAAVTLSSALQELASVFGPAAGGFLIARQGIASAYAAAFLLSLGAVFALLPVRPRRQARLNRGVNLAAIREGVAYVRERRELLGAMGLDMFAVIFAGATALLPVYAARILHVGAGGYGLLTASISLGALATSAVLVLLPPVQRTGRALLLAVGAFGLATIIFGLSRSFPLSLAAYAVAGAVDQVSLLMRHTTIQLLTPDELRGRVSSVSYLFTGSSNQLGVLESGVVAALTSATVAVVSGGIGCLAIVALVTAGMPALRDLRIDHAPAPPPDRDPPA